MNDTLKIIEQNAHKFGFYCRIATGNTTHDYFRLVGVKLGPPMTWDQMNALPASEKIYVHSIDPNNKERGTGFTWARHDYCKPDPAAIMAFNDWLQEKHALPAFRERAKQPKIKVTAKDLITESYWDKRWVQMELNTIHYEIPAHVQMGSPSVMALCEDTLKDLMRNCHTEDRGRSIRYVLPEQEGASIILMESNKYHIGQRVWPASKAGSGRYEYYFVSSYAKMMPGFFLLRFDTRAASTAGKSYFKLIRASTINRNPC